jgi:hypothetical protein
MSLPASTSSSPPGPGGGWLDANPFPVYAAHGYADVTAVSSSTIFTVNSDIPPVPGVTRICWLSPVDWTLYKATVIGTSGSGPYTITIDSPFVNIAPGHLISPQAQNSSTYFNTILNSFATLGPGQKTNLGGLLPRALRHPYTNTSWPSDINASMLRALSDVGEEVLDVSFKYRTFTTPNIPTSITQGPYILTPQYIGLYPL